MASSFVIVTTLSISFRSSGTRNKACADTLNLVRARFEFFTRQRPGDNRRAGRLNGHGDQVFLPFSCLFNIA